MAELPRFTLSRKKNKEIAKQRREIQAAATKAQESTDTNALNEANVELPTTSSPISAAEEVKAYATTALLSATSDNVASFESSPVPSTQVAVAQSILTEEIPVHPVQNTLDNTTTSQEGLAEVKTRIQDHDVETKREKIMKLLDMVPGLEFLDKEFKLTYTNIIDLMNDAFGPSGWSHKIIKCEEQHVSIDTSTIHVSIVIYQQSVCSEQANNRYSAWSLLYSYHSIDHWPNWHSRSK